MRSFGIFCAGLFLALAITAGFAGASLAAGIASGFSLMFVLAVIEDIIVVTFRKL